GSRSYRVNHVFPLPGPLRLQDSGQQTERLLILMPRKSRLTIPSNRLYIQNVFTAARDSLKRLDRTLYHYARAGHPMRTAAAELIRRFDALNKQLADKLKKGDRHL